MIKFYKKEREIGAGIYREFVKTKREKQKRLQSLLMICKKF